MVQAGQTLDNRYRVLDRLGDGSQGEVYKVHDQNENDVVALKLLDPFAAPLGVWAEAQILRRLHDAHILPIRNAATFLGQPYMVTDLAQRGSVDKRILQEPHGLDVATAVRWVRHACQGIQRGHQLGLVHNDIKPGNLFIDGNNACMVGDFGMAGLINSSTSQAIAHGFTIPTVAPEVLHAEAAGSPLAAITSDVYSLAATLFWMLAGEPPHDFSGCADEQQAKALVMTTPARKLRDVAPHVPDSLARVINSALSHDPAKRPQNPTEFAAKLGGRLSGRLWRRTDEHPTHLACHRGARSGRSEYILCTTQGTRASGRMLTTMYAGQNRRVPNGSATTTTARWAADVRRLMDSLP